MLTYDEPVISLPTRMNIAATGSVSLTALGSNFNFESFSHRLIIAGTLTQRSSWVSYSSLLCLISTGISSSHRISISVGNALSTVSIGWTVDSGIISLNFPANRAGTGSLSFTIYGKNLGSTSFSAAVQGHSHSERTSWQSDSSVRTNVPQGAAFTRAVMATVGAKVNTASEVFSFDVPSMSIVFPVNNPPEGSMTFTIFGKMFGKVSRSIISRLGGTSCESSIWASDTTTFCKFAAGIRGTRRVSVTSKRKAGTRTEIFSYNSPGISSPIPSNGPTTGKCNFQII